MSVPKKNKSPWLVRGLVGTALLGLLALVTVIVLRFTLFMPFRVPSGSMWPGVAAGDHVIANGTDTTPARGAVMVFKYPEHPEQLFVKRIVALSGDVVVIKQQRLFINGWEVPHCALGKAVYTETMENVKHQGALEVEFLDGTAYLVFHDANGFATDQQGPFTVKSGEYFVMGDNRENAHDSRMWFGGNGGGVPFANSTGRLRVDYTRPKLPVGAEDLRGALERCLASPPASTPPLKASGSASP